MGGGRGGQTVQLEFVWSGYIGVRSEEICVCETRVLWGGDPGGNDATSLESYGLGLRIGT